MQFFLHYLHPSILDDLGLADAVASECAMFRKKDGTQYTEPFFDGNGAGDYKVLYSPFDLAAGWQGDDHPLSYGYETGDALRLGANLVTYCLTH